MALGDEGAVRRGEHAMTFGNDGGTGNRNKQVERLATSAAELGRVIRRANALPPGFPEDELLALSDALEDAPGAHVETRLEAGLYIRERFVEVRRRFVSESPLDPDIPSIDAIAHCMNDTIAELSSLVVAAGQEAQTHAQPDRAAGTSIVATQTVGADTVEVQHTADRATDDIQHLEMRLRSAPMNVHLDRSRHYQINVLNFSASVRQLKLPVKLIGAIFKGEFLDRAWLDKLLMGLDRARAGLLKAREAAAAFLNQIGSIYDAIRRVTRDIADLTGLVRRVLRRVFGVGHASPQTGTIRPGIDAAWCPEMVVIPPGEFVMGSTEDERQWAREHGAGEHVRVEQPQHYVRVEAPFAVGRYPVTFEEYDHFCDATGRLQPPDNGWGRGRRPVINVSWEDAKAYADWLSEETGQAYRLLSEAEWEYAARAGTTTRHWWGDNVTPDNANYRDSRIDKTTEVGTYAPNPWGLHDMNGNVWEWGEDCWNDSYEGAPKDGSAWMSGDCTLRMIRGGSRRSVAGILRSAYRNRHKFDVREDNFGFRVARTLA